MQIRLEARVRILIVLLLVTILGMFAAGNIFLGVPLWVVLVVVGLEFLGLILLLSKVFKVAGEVFLGNSVFILVLTGGLMVQALEGDVSIRAAITDFKVWAMNFLGICHLLIAGLISWKALRIKSV